LRLEGNGRRTPRVRELRAEQQSHGMLRRLPALFTEDRDQAAFLHGYLATVDGVLYDLDVRASCRDILVDPHGTPAEALDWLASFFGLVLDGRWAEAARRQLVAEIVDLYRLRGTVWALGRYLEIFLAGDRAGEPGLIGVSPVIIEHFRLRGVGGPLLGGEPSLRSRSVVGAGLRVGGAVGELHSKPLDPDDTATSPFSSHAHRFTVLIPRPLVGEEDAAIRHVLDTERPAHTAYDLCTVDAGMRVGNGLHVGISSIVGPTGAFEHTIAGRTLLGRRSILGPPSSGIAVSAARVGTSARVG
jgi:phage tail-like protein